MVPPAFPRPDLLVTLTGVLEILGAIGLFVPRTARLACICLALLPNRSLPSDADRRGKASIDEAIARNL